ncbi:cAMP-binding domain of CRP or a regulatory subunit of cAMP-dependent protein kinases [Faunimonas pinastri]|uniref:cAMP-binding domain of CRP or a regulatory subunit of cAMP-dependent protein kinases n=1 Tax=Faunimonas pinastri TaxID=1855383 RepID=A0A1H9LJ67_9HYPH|nr:Crp/Fnr family transcriptional regulator [Faunimonas pinastri]SER11165.1 cAMP-binding domain of CRP or a regulatory subunit of cAMP-dependent protein kinases [Faunimonas pinastri]
MRAGDTQLAVAEAAESSAPLRKLRQHSRISPQSASILEGLLRNVRAVGAKTPLFMEGDPPDSCAVILKGFAASEKTLDDGRRQIIAIHLPGAFPDMQSVGLSTLDLTLVTLSPCVVARIPHARIRGLMHEEPELFEALWRDMMIDIAVMRQWVVNLGRRTAYERLAHLFCELRVRYRDAGLIEGRALELPMTQAEFGDAIGLSPVHVNRVLKDLRAERLITLTGRNLVIEDWDGLTNAAGFTDGYLYLHEKGPTRNGSNEGAAQRGGG